MSPFLTLVLISLPVFIIADLLWLGVVMKNFYQTNLAGMLRTQPDWTAAGIFYVLFVVGLTFFVTYPGVLGGSLVKTMLIGAFFGLITYATYDLTNQATLNNWPMIVTVVDMAWGALLGALVSGAAFTVFKLFS